jgi:hypothetical protein
MAERKITWSDQVSWINLVWEHLPCRDDVGDDVYDDICTAMAWIEESLGIEDRVEKEMRYFEAMRMNFITKIVTNKGVLNRSDLIERFNISVPQASLDIKKWISLNPNKITYNRSAKRYERSNENE